MRLLLFDYELTGFGGDDRHVDPQKICRAEILLAPYGIDPAPWADENGIEQEELHQAWVKLWKLEEASMPDYDAEFAEDQENQ